MTAMIAAPPFVSYSTFSEAVVSATDWPFVYSSLQALKGHVQEYPGCQGFDVFTRAESEGDVLLHCYTTWDTPEQLEVFLERGYTFERLMADLGTGRDVERSLVLEKIFRWQAGVDASVRPGRCSGTATSAKATSGTAARP